MLTLEVGIFADQDYDKFTEKTTCDEKRKAASKVISVETTTDGEWGTKNVTTMATTNRAKLFYFEVLDCNKAVNDVFKTG